MYFALIPDAKTIAELRSLVQDPPEEFHITMLFSPDRKTQIPPEEVQALLVHPDQSLRAIVGGLHNFGPAGKKVWALSLAPLSWIVTLRGRCETLLEAHGIPWDKTWSFNPHLTICKQPGIALTRNLPEALHFDRIELRY
jgi:2'-5' RNA ligase